MKIRSLFLLIFLFLASCAHHRDVRPGAEGLNRVVVATEDTDEGSRDAINQANHFCKEERDGKSAVFLAEEQKYTGSMDEGTYKTAKTASKVAQAAGGAAHVFGGRNEKTAGGIIGIGGGIADHALGKGYKVDMKFRCE
jgi:hypothetical protein